MSQSSEFDREAALRNPKAFFAEPKEIAAHPQLSREAKLVLLREWERYARRLSVAEAACVRLGVSGNDCSSRSA